MPIGRTDTAYAGPCKHCHGSGKDPKKRTRVCPKCAGVGRQLICRTCGDDMPCRGTNPNIMDQSVCDTLFDADR